MKPDTPKVRILSWLAAGIRWRYHALLGWVRALAGLSKREASTNPYVLEGGRYDSRKYWSERHNRFRHSFRGVGDISRTEEENIRDYVVAVDTMADLLRSVACNPRGKATLDIGCGNGFWTGIFREWGVASYTGTDITDALFDLLRKRYPTHEFIAGKFEHLPLCPGFQLVTMIDVTQHITDDAELRGILNRMRSLLAENGVFIVTFWNEVRPQQVFYETFRLFSFYTAALDGMAHTQPVRFRDKYAAAFYQPGRRPDSDFLRPLRKESIIEISRQILAT